MLHYERNTPPNLLTVSIYSISQITNELPWSNVKGQTFSKHSVIL
jgi:hypothetical protein